MISSLQKILRPSIIAQKMKYFQATTTQTNSSNYFKYEFDLYKSVHVDITQSPQDQTKYIQELQSNEVDWKNQNMKAIWLKLKVEQAELLKETLTNGYQIHHATKDYILLSKWLLENVKSTLPGYASHYVGCGGAVINSKNEVLLVQEKFGYNSTQWSFPGGRADPNEDIYQTAEREIFEELGIKVNARSLLLMRESKKSIFNKPDIYFAFLLYPEDQNPIIKLDKSELLDYRWVPMSEIDEFYKKEKVSQFHVQRKILDNVNQLYKSGFDFQKDKLTNKIPYYDYPNKGNVYTITDVKID